MIKDETKKKTSLKKERKKITTCEILDIGLIKKLNF